MRKLFSKSFVSEYAKGKKKRKKERRVLIISKSFSPFFVSLDVGCNFDFANRKKRRFHFTIRIRGKLSISTAINVNGRKKESE